MWGDILNGKSAGQAKPAHSMRFRPHYCHRDLIYTFKFQTAGAEERRMAGTTGGDEVAQDIQRTAPGTEEEETAEKMKEEDKARRTGVTP